MRKGHKEARPNAAVRHLVRAVPRASEEDTVGRVLASLQERRFDSITAVYVLDSNEQLIGLVPLHLLLSEGPDRTMSDLMQHDPPIAFQHDDQERVADIAVQHGLSAVPVVDEGLRFLGVVPAETLMRILRHEHIEDLHRFTGIMNGESQAHLALEAPPLQRAKNRLPWLMVGLLGSMLATWVMAYFEATLEARIAVAFFIPGIVYLADAIGTQTEAIAVRGISFGNSHPLRALLAGEIKTGLLIGSFLGLMAFPLVFAFFRDVRLAMAVGLAIFTAGGTATGIGMLFPWMLFKAGKDPALGSGPVATIIQDVLSILVYFFIVILLVK
jgi:magnesium transporter